MVRDDGRQITKLVLCERIMMVKFEIVKREDIVDFTKGIIDVRITLRKPVSLHDQEQYANLSEFQVCKHVGVITLNGE